MSNYAISVEGLSKHYYIGAAGHKRGYKSFRDVVAQVAAAPFRAMRRSSNASSGNKESFWALQDVSFKVNQGEVLGVIGRNGAGKSTLLKLLSRITEPTKGEIRLRGRVGSLLEVGTGFHPELTGRENVFLNGAVLGMHRYEIARKFDEIVAFAEVEKFIDTPVKRYSSGMYLRLAFAVAAHLEPEILLVDEVLAVGDAAFQKKCLGKMSDVAGEGRTVLFVSHNMAAIQNLCNSACMLQDGQVAITGNVNDVVVHYLKTSSEVVDGTIANRTDRKGDQTIKFLDFITISQGMVGNTVTCGSPVEFCIKYQSEKRLDNVHISIGVLNTYGEKVLFLSNDMTNTTFENTPINGTFVCQFDKLPLLPGTYTLNLFSTVNGVISDWVMEAVKIQVIEGDYFGTGKLPPTGYGQVIANHQWKVVLHEPNS